MNNSSNFAQAADKVRTAADKTGVTSAYHQVEEAIEERPMSAIMLSFGIGLGVGLALGGMIAAGSHSEAHKSTAEKMGQQLIDALGRIVPSSISNRFSS